MNPDFAAALRQIAPSVSPYLPSRSWPCSVIIRSAAGVEPPSAPWWPRSDQNAAPYEGCVHPCVLLSEPVPGPSATQTPTPLKKLEESVEGWLALEAHLAGVSHVSPRKWSGRRTVRPSPQQPAAVNYLLKIEDVLLVRESPYRLSPEIGRRILALGETSWGMTIVRFHFRCGRVVSATITEIVDFMAFPDGLDPDDLVDVSKRTQDDVVEAAAPPIGFCDLGTYLP